MRKYEMMTILSLDDKGSFDSKKYFNETFSSLEMKVIEEKDMGVRDLAYPIKKITRGHYFLFQLETENQKNIALLNKNLKLNKNILRTLLLVKDE